MGVEPCKRFKEDQEGQSVLEFLLFLPVFLTLLLLLYRIQLAIQVSIVNQQYARSQALFLTFNHPYYPELVRQGLMRQYPLNQMVLGVSDNLASGESYSPQATLQSIIRPGKPLGSDAPKEEPLLRGKVRVRGTVTLCTSPWWIQNGSGAPVLNLPLGSQANGFPAMGVYQMSEASQWGSYLCGSPLTYE